MLVLRRKSSEATAPMKMKATVSLMLGVVLTLSIFGVSFAAHKGQAAQTFKKPEFPLRVTDQANHKVFIKAKPTRIASTTEGEDEILSALVPKKDIVLVTAFASNPSYSNIVNFVKGIPKIGNANAEQILAVRPDLVLMASYDTPGVVGQIEQTGVPVYEFADFNSFANIEKNILITGRLTGTTAKAEVLVAHMRQELAALKKMTKNRLHPTILDDSSYGFAAGRNTTVNSVIVAAGGVNAANQLNGWQKITDEEIVKMNPSVIIDASDDAPFLKQLASNPALQTVSAIQHHRLYAINSADMTSVSQYAVQGARDLAAMLYPSHR